jgi:hypothetical protein
MVDLIETESKGPIHLPFDRQLPISQCNRFLRDFTLVAIKKDRIGRNP